MFDREGGLPSELVTSIFSFFTSTQAAKIARTCTLFNTNSIARVNELQEKIKTSPLTAKVLIELEKRCQLFCHQNSYYMQLNAHGINSCHGKPLNEALLEHEFIKLLIQNRDTLFYFYSIDGSNFYGMDNQGSSGSDTYTQYSFVTEEMENNKRRCEIHVDKKLNQVSVLRGTVNYCTGPRPLPSEVFATYHAAHPLEKRMVLMQLLMNESRLFPVQYSEKPVGLLRCRKPDQYILALSVGEGICYHTNRADRNYKVLMGNNNSWQEIPIEHVDNNRREETTSIVFDRTSGYRSVFMPHFFDKKTKRTLTLSDGKILKLQAINHWKFDFSSIGIKLDPPKPRSTLLDFYEAKELEAKQTLKK